MNDLDIAGTKELVKNMYYSSSNLGAEKYLVLYRIAVDCTTIPSILDTTAWSSLKSFSANTVVDNDYDNTLW